MRIIPIINTRLEKHPACKGGNVAQNSAYIYLSALNPGFDMVSFKKKVVQAGMSPSTFKKKLSKHMICIYTGKPFATTKMMNKMKSRKYFKGSISHVVEKVKPYKVTYLEPIELGLFEIIEKEAVKTPDITLEELFDKLFYASLMRIEKLQKPLMQHIEALGAELPEEYSQKFLDYIAIAKKQVRGEPIPRNFSKKEFLYKLIKLSNNITDAGLLAEIKKVVAEFEGTNKKKTIKSVFNEFLKFLNIKPKKALTEDEMRIKLIESLRDMASVKGYKKIARLCDDNIKMLRHEDVYVPFSNKAFTYDITRILSKAPDNRAKEGIMVAARSLPSSSSSIDALIIKFKDANPDDIGDRLFNPSFVSLEHLSPQSKGGKTDIKNCALARRGPNSKRGNEPFSVTLRKNNYPKKNQQKYANRLTALVKEGLMNPEDALSQIEQIEKQGNITLNKSKLLKIIQEC